MTEQILNKRLQESSRYKLEQFNKIRGVEVKAGEFWDVVVITAVDDHQKSSYQLQISEKIMRMELPLGLQYHVFSDPPGYKIGNGGSTLHALHELTEIYGASVCKLKILLIHAGGWSQRLPSASALGKIFLSVPLGEPLYQMLDLKLALFVHLPRRMNPGVLVTCADDLVLYSAEEEPGFDRPGVSALAHPSPLSVGTTHGVFVLEPGVVGVTGRDVEYRACSHFLHKPSMDTMRHGGAVFRKEGIAQEEWVYTDSSFYMDHTTVASLLELYHQIQPLICEVDAYGDFLQSLGSGNMPEYIHTPGGEEGELLQVREKIFHHLRGTPFNVVVLNESRFYHLGTMNEYLHHLTQDPHLQEALGLLSNGSSLLPPDVYEGRDTSVIHSVVQPGARLSPGVVLEYSRLEPEVTVGQNSIISGCWVESGLSVPPLTFLHTLRLSSHNAPGRFVTVAFGVLDDLKRTSPDHASLSQLELLGRPLQEHVSRWGWNPEGMTFSGSGRSLWSCRLFPVCMDMRSSFRSTLLMVQGVRGGGQDNGERISLQDALQGKDLENMLKFRRELREEIMQKK